MAAAASDRGLWDVLRAAEEAGGRVCRIVGAFVRLWNDAAGPERARELLEPLVPRICRTAAPAAVEQARMWLAVDWAIRERLSGLLQLADRRLQFVAAPIVDQASLEDARRLVFSVLRGVPKLCQLVEMRVQGAGVGYQSPVHAAWAAHVGAPILSEWQTDVALALDTPTSSHHGAGLSSVSRSNCQSAYALVMEMASR